MSYFEVHYEGPRGDIWLKEGGQENLGSTLGYQRAKSLSENSRYVIVTFDQGATIKIPNRRVLKVVEGSE